MLSPAINRGRVNVWLSDKQKKDIERLTKPATTMFHATMVKRVTSKGDELLDRLERARDMKDVTFAFETSVHNAGGSGLYSLKTLNVGTILPHPYPGMLLSRKDHDRLATQLVKLTNTPSDKVDIVSTVNELKKEWNILFFPRILTTSAINWDIVYDTFCAYSFATNDGSILFWNEFDTSGRAHTLETNPRHAGLFINEPPPYMFFTNRLTWLNQPSTANVMPVSKPDGSGIRFRVTRKIRRGDEILFHYGPEYKRTLPDGTEYPVLYEDDLLERFPGNRRIAKRVREYQSMGPVFCKDNLGVVGLTVARIQRQRIF